jgi:hypothetical protein
MLLNKQFLRRGTEKGAPSAVRIFQFRLSLKTFLNRRQARQEVLRKLPGTGRRVLLKKCRKLRPKVKGVSSVSGASLQDMFVVPLSKVMNELMSKGRHHQIIKLQSNIVQLIQTHSGCTPERQGVRFAEFVNLFIR